MCTREHVLHACMCRLVVWNASVAAGTWASRRSLTGIASSRTRTSQMCVHIHNIYIQFKKVYTYMSRGLFGVIFSHVLFKLARTRVRTYQMSLYAYVCVLKCGTGASFNTKANVAENAQTHQRRCTQLWHPFYCAMF